MRNEAARRRAQFLERARTYATSHRPTDGAAHGLCSAFVEMLACDRGEHVTLTIGKTVIARGAAQPSSTAR
ncbi:hypothetical protein [Paraburkholderia largidicola]|uniref:Uncharacterized protein n=1 Tax=Paraburkholderia largidicola TaxID=3014751 RepID=A0A7I8BKP1_9BURK|nr:hypothetical protein [Paraburkholderia sp. PGU16]BCF88720.1 hypothetical protein PPGU16_17870 [Paraburkholderia sp. PGU16]